MDLPGWWQRRESDQGMAWLILFSGVYAGTTAHFLMDREVSNCRRGYDHERNYIVKVEQGAPCWAHIFIYI